jgi:hypothetical protein
MATDVYLHIGLPKTGTTYLQTTMWENREALSEQGFLYPGGSRMAHYRAQQQLRSRRSAKADPPPWDALVAEIHEWPGRALISHEFFCMLNKKKAARAIADLAPARVQVVVTARSYALQFPAVWQEALKMGSKLTFDEFMVEVMAGNLSGGWSWDSQDLPRVLRRWRGERSPDLLSVITVPAPGAPRELLWQRWTEALGLDDSRFDLAISHANESIGAPQAALLHRMRPYLSGPLTVGNERHRWLRHYFGHEVLVPQRGPRFTPRPEDVDELVARSERAAAAVRRGGYHVVGDLDDLLAQPQPTGSHPDDVSDADIVEVAARAIEQMIRDVRDLTLERDEARRSTNADVAKTRRKSRR